MNSQPRGSHSIPLFKSNNSKFEDKILMENALFIVNQLTSCQQSLMISSCPSALAFIIIKQFYLLLVKYSNRHAELILMEKV